MTFRLVMTLLLLAPVAALSQEPRMIDVGGHRLEALVAGSGTPVVVFEAGGGDDLSAWTPVFAAVAEYTTVVAYSRAGTGNSEPGPQPASFEVLNEDLRALMKGLELSPPFVLVGHSRGGLIVRSHYNNYPEDVAALVLVDPSHERQRREFMAVDSTFGGWPDGDPSTWDPLIQVQWAGELPNNRPLDNLPVYILTHFNAAPSGNNVVAAQERYRVWRALHAELFEAVQHGAHVVSQRSGHYIQRDEPDLVVWAVRRAVEDVRWLRSR